jgi:hypothetical protein
VVDGRPDDLEARGCWLALDLALNPDTVWLWLPTATSADTLAHGGGDGADVVWPAEAMLLVERAMPTSGKRFTALRNAGVHTIER